MVMRVMRERERERERQREREGTADSLKNNDSPPNFSVCGHRKFCEKRVGGIDFVDAREND